MERMRSLTVEEECWFTKEDMKVIFSDIQVILRFHESFLQLLEGRWTNWSVFQCVGDIFLSMVSLIEVDSFFCSNDNNHFLIQRNHLFIFCRMIPCTSILATLTILPSLQFEFKSY